MKNALSFLLIFLIVSCSEEPIPQETKILFDSDLLIKDGLIFEKNSSIRSPYSGIVVDYKNRTAGFIENGKSYAIQYYDEEYLLTAHLSTGDSDLKYTKMWYSDSPFKLGDTKKRGVHCTSIPYLYVDAAIDADKVIESNIKMKRCEIYTDKYYESCIDLKLNSDIQSKVDLQEYPDEEIEFLISIDIDKCIEKYGTIERVRFPGIYE